MVLEKWCPPVACHPEQAVAKWNRRKRNRAGEWVVEEARLDVSFPWHATRTHVDVAFATAATTETGRTLRDRAQVDGSAAQEKVHLKMGRYPPDSNPGEVLVPFVVEALGRPSDEAVAFLRAVAPTEPRRRAVVLGQAWRDISIITQTRLAELYLSAERPRAPRAA